MKCRPLPQSSSSNDFECHICLDACRLPILTRCGHLFCSDCLSTWLNQGSNTCPVCKAFTSLSSVIPIYGRGVSSEKFLRNQSIGNSCENEADVPLPNADRSSCSLPALPFLSRTHLTPIHSESSVRRRATTHFLICLGLVLIVMIISS